MKVNLHSLEETRTVAQDVAKKIKPGAVLAFYGEIGAGKTTFIKALTNALTGINEEDVTSPTFVFLHCYSSSFDLYHFDLYRIDDEKEFLDKGFREYLNGNESICMVEWPDKIASLLPPHTIKVHMNHISPSAREITFENFSF